MEDGESVEAMFTKLPISRSLSTEQIAKANSLFVQLKAKGIDWEGKKAKSALQASIYLSCICSQLPLNIASLFDDSSEVHHFMLSLKEAIKTVHIDLQAILNAKRLIKL